MIASLLQISRCLLKLSVVAIAAVALAGSYPTFAQPAAPPVLLGTAVAIEPLRQDGTYARILRETFDIITPEQVMKFDALQPQPGDFAFEDADFLVDFAEQHDMQLRGHVLVAPSQLPGWLSETEFTRAEMKAILRLHILTTVGRYRGRIHQWDVVNEAVEANGSLRDSLWLRTIGPEYIRLAFQWAHEADPNAKLYYNDFGAERLNSKATAVYELISGLLDEGVPVHGVGFQMHVAVEDAPLAQDFAAVAAQFSDLGLQVAVTEMDVKIQNSTQPLPETLDAQADLFGNIAGACVAEPACSTFTTWGFTDRHSWIPEHTGRPDAALPFDEHYRPKPAYFAICQALRARDPSACLMRQYLPLISL